MEKLVVFPLNNDTEILIKGLKENKLYQVVAVSVITISHCIF